jgi:hypothetical protein
MSAKNGLKINSQDPELELTELEGNLIAKRIVFMKIFQLPKSRWTALKDKVINVPVNEEDIINTITRLPRTPNEAVLIEVDLKRKVEYKNAHIKQLIDPEKCFKMLELLKRSRNPHFQFYDDYNTYTLDRATRLSNQYYFIQRICNQNPKFARSHAYVYADVAHTELKQIQRNINVLYSRGKETNNTDGVKTLKLDDPFAVLDDIKQTPRYWKRPNMKCLQNLTIFLHTKLR